MLPNDLEDWLTAEGDRVVRKEAASGHAALGAREQLLYEVWLFDTEQRNGGVSQYFCNCRENWEQLCRLAQPAIPSFALFAAAVNKVIGGSEDPYQSVIDSDVNLDEMYRAYQIQLVTELKALFNADNNLRR
jgi:hypothetical protein